MLLNLGDRLVSLAPFKLTISFDFVHVILSPLYLVLSDNSYALIAGCD